MREEIVSKAYEWIYLYDFEAYWVLLRYSWRFLKISYPHIVRAREKGGKDLVGL